MNYRPYESISQRRGRRNKGNERAILASGICAFISSYFANLATNGSIEPKVVLLAPAFIIGYLLLYWLYGKCYEAILNNAALSKLFFGKLHREDVTHVIAEEIPTDLASLLDDFIRVSEGKELLVAKAHYEIANILDFLDHYSGTVYIAKPGSGGRARSASTFISSLTIQSVFANINCILNKCNEFGYDSKNLLQRNVDIAQKYGLRTEVSIGKIEEKKTVSPS